MQVWQLSLPLPAVLMISVSLYMLLLGVALWIRHCLKDRWSPECVCDCCPSVSVSEQCLTLAEMCNCSLPTAGHFLPQPCSPISCSRWDCACTCQPPECQSCNCLCFEIRIK